jgi:hypothetical protein
MGAAWHVPETLCLLARQPKLDSRFLWASLGLIGILLVGALIIWWADRWRKRTAAPPEGSGDQLSHFRELYERGELSPEEFERIRGLLGQRLRQELDVPPPPPPDGRPAEPPETGIRPAPPP